MLVELLNESAFHFQNCVPRKTKNQDVMQNRIMYSKFLYHRYVNLFSVQNAK